jgi:lysophospholipase L1-like esterase
MILTVGDSFTYGEELSNRTVEAWPYLVSKLLNTPVTNLGVGGASNDYIFRTTVEQTIQTKYDIVIVAWSDTSRLEVCYKDTILCVNAHGRRNIPWVPDYYKYSYNEKFGFRKWFVQTLALQQYLKSINQPYLFVNVAGLQGHYNEYKDEFSYIWNSYDASNYLEWEHSGLIEWQGDCPKGPGGHPLGLGHQRIADKIYEHIRNISRVS